MRRTTLVLILVSSTLALRGQADTTSSENDFLSRIFLPSIDVGYQIPNSDLIQGAVKFATTIEYRIRNNNDFFIRVSYDTYNTRYQLEDASTSNAIEGTVQISDLFIAPGYRMGDQKFRLMVALMPGIKFYEFPTADITGNQILISQKGRSLFTTSILATAEYYFDPKSAFTFSIYQNQVWKKRDFWADGTSAIGFSIGFITSLVSG